MLDISIEAAEGRDDTVIITSQAMDCCYPVKRADLGSHVQALHTEWVGLVEAGEL